MLHNCKHFLKDHCEAFDFAVLVCHSVGQSLWKVLQATNSLSPVRQLWNLSPVQRNILLNAKTNASAHVENAHFTVKFIRLSGDATQPMV